MLTGAHAIIYSSNPEADRAFFRDVLKLRNIDVGNGWLVFSLPPSEVALHPAEQNDKHELYLICDDVRKLVAELESHDIPCKPIQDQGWGLLTALTLPSGGSLGVYEPRQART
jgi:hypothetical protein